MTSLSVPVLFGPIRAVLAACVLLLGIVWFPSPASAHMAQTTRFIGHVQSIDYKNKTVTIQPDPTGKTLSLGWNWRTGFFADDKPSTAEALKAGMKVKVKYTSVLFGREYASKLEWTSR